MLNKKGILMATLLVFLLAISAVGAADNNTSDVVGIEETAEEVVSVENNEETELGVSEGTFTDLANDIANAKSTLNLNRNYKFNMQKDSNYKIGIFIEKSIVINGNGYTINGNNQGSAFMLLGSNVVLNNINFVNCACYHEERFMGGAILVDTRVANCRLSGCSFKNCGAEYDGAIDSRGKYIELTGCSFENCVSDHGSGAVSLSWSNGTISDCSFVNCHAPGGYGGAVSCYSENAALSGCSFINCTSGHDGGAVYWNGETGTLSDCSFENCAVLGYYDEEDEVYTLGDGGAVYFYLINGRIVESNFVNCSANDGGAVYWVGEHSYTFDFGNNGILSGCNFVKCSALGCYSDYEYVSGNGGAIYWGGINGTVAESTFVNCSALGKDDEDIGGNGGAIYWASKEYDYEYDDEGEGHDIIIWYGANGTLTGCSFENCVASGHYDEENGISSGLGGAVYWSGDNGKIIKSDFTNCHADACGGGIYFTGAGCSLINSTFMGNTAKRNSDFYSKKPLNITTAKTSTALNAPDVSTTYETSVNLIATLTDKYNMAMPEEQIKILLNEVEYSLKTNSQGQVSLAIPTDLVPKTYVATVSYAGSDDYQPSTTTANVAVNKAVMSISASKITVEYNDDSKLVATLTNAGTGKAISGANLKFNLNGVDTTAKTDSKGEAKVSTNGLAPGSYTATITYGGNAKYKSAVNTADVVVNKATVDIACKNTYVSYNSGNELIATLTNTASAKAVSSATVRVNINGEETTLKTDSKGQVKVSTKGLAIGTYATTVSYAGNAKYNPASTSVNLVVTKSDINIFANSTENQFVATLTNAATGKAISSAKVNVNLNGVDYALKTDSKGEVTVSTENLTAYTAVVSYAGNAKYNPVSTTVNANNKISTAVYAVHSKETDELIATFTNAATGKAITNANVKVDLDGVTTSIKTNSKGQAIVSTADLTPGTHDAAVSYQGNSKYAPSSTAITLNQDKANIILSTVYSKDKQKLVVTLTNSRSGKAASGANVKVNINGVTTTFKTNSKGQITVSTADLTSGTYDATLSYAGNSKYNSIAGTVKVNV